MTYALQASAAGYHRRFFEAPLAETDPDVAAAIRQELRREQDHIELIASENIVSRAVLEAQGSVMTNKYAEGYPGRRYYGGCEFVDIAEALAIERAKKLFRCEFANVQPHSGAQANGAVYLALMKAGETLLGMSLAAGGHLTHGAPPSISGKWLHAVQYGVRRDDALIDFDEVERLALEHKPKVIVAGGSAYPRIIDFARFRAIADQVGAYFMVDMAHFAGLVAAGVHPSPFPHAHVVTTTTHKTLRGPRGGMILAQDPDLAKKINAAVFPGLQGGPLMHVIAAKAVAFGEALRPEFKTYAEAVVENAKILASTLHERGLDIVSGGTDTHLMLVDLRPKRLTGKAAEESLGRALADLQQERHSVRSGEADDHLGRSPRHAGRHDARLWNGGVPPCRRVDRRRAGRTGGAPGRQRRGGSRGAGAGRGALRPVSGLRRRLTAIRRNEARNGEDEQCAVPSAGTMILRSRIRVRPRITRRFGGGAIARLAAPAGPPSSACICANSRSSRRTASARRSIATNCSGHYASPCASGPSTTTGSSASSTASSDVSKHWARRKSLPKS